MLNYCCHVFTQRYNIAGSDLFYIDKSDLGENDSLASP